jgi:mRNA export factor
VIAISTWGINRSTRDCCSNQSITTGKFNARGDIFAYTLSYDWSMGAEKYNQSQPSVIRLHSVAEAEIKQKKKPGTGSRNSF